MVSVLDLISSDSGFKFTLSTIRTGVSTPRLRMSLAFLPSQLVCLLTVGIPVLLSLVELFFIALLPL